MGFAESMGWGRSWLRGAVCATALAVVGCSSEDEPRSDAPVAATRASLQGQQQYNLTLKLPPGATLQNTALHGTAGVHVEHDTVIQSEAGGWPVLVNIGSQLTAIGEDTVLGDILSQAAVSLDDRVRVNGSVKSAGNISTDSGVVITGQRLPNTPLGTLQELPLTITFPTATASVTVPFGGTNNLAPGSYSQVTIRSNATLRLTTGTYYFVGLDMASSSTLRIDTTGGPVLLYVRDAIDLEGRLDLPGNPRDFLVGYFGSELFWVNTPFRGSILAPFAKLNLDNVGSAGHRGSFFAKEIEVDDDITPLLHVPFAHWGSVLLPRPTLECVRYTASTREAIFGYVNESGVPIQVPLGPLNHFEPAVPGFQPITTFQPGTFTRAMAVPMSGDSLTWVVGTTRLTADRNSASCGISGESAGQPAAASVARLLPNLVSKGHSLVPPPVLVPPAATAANQSSSSGGSGSIGVVQQALGDAATGSFTFRLTSITVPDGDNGGEQEPILQEARINGMNVPANTAGVSTPIDLPDCEEDSTCTITDAFRVDVPVDQQTVTVHIVIHEDDDLFNDNETELVLDLTVDNFTGLATGTAFSPSPSATVQIQSGETCKVVEGWGLCWRIEPAGRPKICTTWKAQYLDGGPAPGSGVVDAEDYLAGRDLQEVPAAFAAYELVVSDPGGVRFRFPANSGQRAVLNAEGCVPYAERPSAAVLATGQASGPVTIQLKLLSQLCLDPAGNNCQCRDAQGNRCAVDTGAEFSLREGFGSGVESFCSELSEDATRSVPDCNTNDSRAAGTTLADWSNGFPPNRVDIRHPDRTDTVRIAAVVSTLLQREATLLAEGVVGGLGILYALDEKNFASSLDSSATLAEKIIHIAVNTICSAVGDSCAGDPVSLRNNARIGNITATCTPGEAGCLPADSWWKFVIAHELGHVIQRRGFGDIARNFGNATSTVDICQCNHIVTSNTLHCLQSLESSGAAQGEAFGHFFAAAAFNDPGADCRFNYYKEFLFESCMPGFEPIGGCIDVGGGRLVTLPPVPVSCVQPARWRNKHCAAGLTDLANTIEFDWMGFYRNLVQGATPVLNYKELSEVYQRACVAEGVPCNNTIDVVFEAPAANQRALLSAVEQKFGLGDPRSINFANRGDEYGVSRDTTP